jgi:hypothetical protein
MTNHERIKLAFGEIKAPEGFANKILKAPETAYRKPRIRKPVVIAAVITISVLMFGTAALAYTGVLSDVFSAITGGTGEVDAYFTNDTRRAIVENEHVAVNELPPASIADDSSKLELIAFFADANEIWFNFILSNADIPDYWNAITDQLLPRFFSLELNQNDGTVNRFERTIDENRERNTFPGGYTIYDRERNLIGHRFDDDCQTFGYSTTVSLRDDGSLDITFIVEIFSRNATFGDKAYLQIGNFMFNSVKLPDDTVRTIHNKIYEFEIEIDSRFTKAATLIYIPANLEEVAQMGITIHSVTVTPTATKVEVTIDTSKNNIMNPDYAVFFDSIDFGNGNPPLPPENLSQDSIMSLMNLNIYAVSDTGEYKQFMGVSGSREENIINGWWAFSSTYFDAPENLTLVFETRVFGGEFIGGDVRIPLVLVG